MENKKLLQLGSGKAGEVFVIIIFFFYSREQRAERMCLHIHSATAARVEYPATQLRYKFDAPSVCCGVFDWRMDKLT